MADMKKRLARWICRFKGHVWKADGGYCPVERTCTRCGCMDLITGRVYP